MHGQVARAYADATPHHQRADRGLEVARAYADATVYDPGHGPARAGHRPTSAPSRTKTGMYSYGASASMRTPPSTTSPVWISRQVAPAGR